MTDDPEKIANVALHQRSDLMAEIERLRARERATIAAILYTIQGEVEGAPTSAINYLQRLRAMIDEIEHLRASETAWKIIAKQNSRWNALPQSEKEAALSEALGSEVADGIKAADEIERLRAKLAELEEKWRETQRTLR